MSKKKANWPVSIGIGIAIGLAVLVILKQGTRMETDRQTYKVMIDLKALKSAIEQYKAEFGDYPKQQKGYLLNFAEQLSKIQPSKDVKEPRKMFVDYDQYNMVTSNPNYAAPNADATFLLDPWGEKYMYEKGDGSFVIWSSGADKVNSKASDDDISVHAVNKEKILKERELKKAAQEASQ